MNSSPTAKEIQKMTPLMQGGNQDADLAAQQIALTSGAYWYPNDIPWPSAAKTPWYNQEEIEDAKGKNEQLRHVLLEDTRRKDNSPRNNWQNSVTERHQAVTVMGSTKLSELFRQRWVIPTLSWHGMSQPDATFVLN